MGQMNSDKSSPPHGKKIMTPVIYLTRISFTSHLKILAIDAYKCVQVFCLLFGNFYTWAMAPQKAAGALIVILHHKSAERLQYIPWNSFRTRMCSVFEEHLGIVERVDR